MEDNTPETVGHKVFVDAAARKLFANLYEDLDEKHRAAFGKAIRDKFDAKIVSDGPFTSFYLDQHEVARCYDSIK